MASAEELFEYAKRHAIADDVESVLETIDDHSRRHEGLHHL